MFVFIWSVVRQIPLIFHSKKPSRCRRMYLLQRQVIGVRRSGAHLSWVSVAAEAMPNLQGRTEPPAVGVSGTELCMCGIVQPYGGATRPALAEVLREGRGEASANLVFFLQSV